MSKSNQYPIKNLTNSCSTASHQLQCKTLNAIGISPLILPNHPLVPTNSQTELLSKQQQRNIVPCIPRSPKSSNSPQVSFFIKYYRETIGYAHYCLFNDYHQLCNKFLLAIAERYDPLRYAIVAFSALVCSARITFAREQAFFHYAITLQEMRLRLGSPPTDMRNTKEWWRPFYSCRHSMYPLSFYR